MLYVNTVDADKLLHVERVPYVAFELPYSWWVITDLNNSETKWVAIRWSHEKPIIPTTNPSITMSPALLFNAVNALLFTYGFAPIGISINAECPSPRIYYTYDGWGWRIIKGTPGASSVGTTSNTYGWTRCKEETLEPPKSLSIIVPTQLSGFI